MAVTMSNEVWGEDGVGIQSQRCLMACDVDADRDVSQTFGT